MLVSLHEVLAVAPCACCRTPRSVWCWTAPLHLPHQCLRSMSRMTVKAPGLAQPPQEGTMTSTQQRRQVTMAVRFIQQHLRQQAVTGICCTVVTALFGDGPPEVRRRGALCVAPQ